MVEFSIPEEVAGTRLDVYCAAVLGMSRGIVQTALTDKEILVDGKAAKPSLKLKGGEVVTSPDRLQGSVPPTERLQPEALPLAILYEDDSILVLNKPLGILVHPDSYTDHGTLVQAVLAHYPPLKDVVYDPESTTSALRPGVVHRLDRDTTGVLVMAKTKEALASLSAQFHNHNVRKSYAVLLFGSLKESTTVDMNLRRKPARKNLMGVTTKEGEGKSAITHFDPIHVYDWQGTPLTFCQCRIETGRTHQIRVHAKYLGHAVIGDPLYSSRPSEKVSKSLRVSRQMLHAHTLCIRHPQTKEEITFEAPLPDDFQSLLERLPEASSLC